MVHKYKHITTYVSQPVCGLWTLEISLKCKDSHIQSNIWQVDRDLIYFLIFPQGIDPFELCPAVHSSWMIIHLTFSTACAPTFQKKVKGVFPKCSSKAIKHIVTFNPRRQIIMRGTLNEVLSLRCFLLRSQWVISRQNNKKYLCLIEQSRTRSKKQEQDGWSVKMVPLTTNLKSATVHLAIKAALKIS